jgi:hypothetical protein
MLLDMGIKARICVIFIFYIAVIVGAMGKCDTFTATSGLYRDARQ